MRLLSYYLAGVEARYRDKTALMVGELALRGGQLNVVAGLNGSGKSTLLNVLAFLMQPTQGTVKFSRKTRPLGPNTVTRAQTIRDIGTSGPVLVPRFGSLECCLRGESERSRRFRVAGTRAGVPRTGRAVRLRSQKCESIVGRRSTPGRACPRSGLQSGSDIARRTACLRG